MLLASNLFPASFYTVIASCTGEPHFTDKDEHGNAQSLISSLDSPLGSRHVQERTQKRLCHQPHNHTHSTKEYSRSLSLPITRCYVVVTFSDLCFFCHNMHQELPKHTPFWHFVWRSQPTINHQNLQTHQLHLHTPRHLFNLGGLWLRTRSSFACTSGSCVVPHGPCLGNVQLSPEGENCLSKAGYRDLPHKSHQKHRLWLTDWFIIYIFIYIMQRGSKQLYMIYMILPVGQMTLFDVVWI